MRCAAGYGLDEIQAKPIYDELAAVAPKVLPYMDRVWSLLDVKRREGKRILFEGAQGTLLDVDHGTYPFVTSSNTVAGAGGERERAGPGRDRLCARHLQGLHDARRRGAVPDRAAERRSAACSASAAASSASVTGRPRRCGWFDAVLVRQTARTSGINGLALTKLDILDGFDEIKVCVGYRLDGREIDYLPASAQAQARRRADLRNRRRLERGDGRGKIVGRIARAGDKVRAANRGIGGLSGGFAIDQSGAGGHNPGAEPVRSLKPRA